MAKVDNKRVCIGQKGTVIRILPNVITVTSFCFGLIAVRFALLNKWETAVACVLISALLDSLDGRVARMIGHSSKFGAELDSLSDLVCFGVAPAMLLFLKVFQNACCMKNIGWGICMFFAICCALRLARFNAVQVWGEEQQPDWMKKYFTGVPAPAGAFIALFPFVLHFSTGNCSFLNPFFVSVCALFSGIMMISRIKSFSSKMAEFKDGFASPELVVASLIVICMMTAPWVTLSWLIAIYIAVIPYSAYCYRCRKMADAAENESNSKLL